MTKSDVINFINTMLTRPLTALSKLKDVLLYLLDFVSSSTSDALPLWTNTQTFNLDGSGDGIYCKYADTNGKVRLFETKTSGNINHQPPTDPDISENTYWRELSPGAGSSMKQWAASLYGTGDIIVWWNHSVYGIGFYLLVEPVRPFNSTDIEAEILTGKWLRIPQIKTSVIDAWDPAIAADTGYATGDTVRYSVDEQIYHSAIDANPDTPGATANWVLDSETPQPDLDLLFGGNSAAQSFPQNLGISGGNMPWNLNNRYTGYAEVSTALTTVNLTLSNFKKGTNAVLFLEKTGTADLQLNLALSGYSFISGNETITGVKLRGAANTIYAIKFHNLSQAGAIAGIMVEAFNPSRPQRGVVHSKNAHGFAVKDLITIDGTGAFVKATSISDDVIGIVTYINSANKFTLQSSGFVDGLSALVAGTKYYVQSDGSLGTTITDKFYGKATSTTELMIISGGSTALTDALVFKGVIDCSANPNYPAGNAGDTYKISVAGKIGGGAGVNVEIGDLILCITDGSVAGNHATVGANWSIQQANLDGAVIGPAASTNDNIATYNGATGKIIKDSGVSITAIPAANITPDSTHRFVTDTEKTEYSRLTPTAVKTANYNAVAGDLIPVDTTASDIVITLPTAPADKTQIGIKMVIQGGTNKVTYNAGGTDVFNKAGGGTSGSLYLVSQAVLMQYKASSGIWYIAADDLPLPDVQLGSFNYAVCAGTNTLTCSLIPAITAYPDGLRIFLKTVNENTTGVTLNVNGVGAKALVKNANQALAPGDLKVGVHCAVYNSTTDAFHILGPVMYEQALRYVIDGGGAVISTGVKGDDEIPFNCTVVGVDLLADQSGSIVLDIWKDTYANYPPTVADSITASAKPTLSSATKSTDSTLTGWTKTFTKGDTLRWNVDSASTVQRVTVVLRVIRT